MALSQTQILERLAAADFASLVGEFEGDYLECKRQPYLLSHEGQRLELAFASQGLPFPFRNLPKRKEIDVDFQIRCINNPHERITNVGGDGWTRTQAEVIRLIETGQNRFFVSVAGSFIASGRRAPGLAVTAG